MDFIDPRWANSAESAVTAVVDGEPATFPKDERNRHYAALLAAGLVIAAYAPPPPQVPEAVLRHQGLIALLSVGITEQAIRDKIALIEDLAQREMTRLRFEQPEWRRDSDFIAWGAGEFSMSASEIDQLFIAAWAN